MAKNILIQLYMFLTYLIGFGQTIPYEDIGFMPENLEECSGMAYMSPNILFHINDSGNKPEVFVTDTTGKLLQSHCIPGITNVDWEEITIDNNGNLYIGDFGNNNNRRKDLVIYKVKASDILLGKNDMIIEEIHFSYPDQESFPPERAKRNFDMEAMVHRDNGLYLFSKNRTSPFNGYTHCYRLPDHKGDFVAEKADSFKTGVGVMESYWISGAAYDEDRGILILLGYDKLWTFRNFSDKSFFDGSSEVAYFNNFSQKEAICFVPETSSLYFTEEKNTDDDGKLYSIPLDQPEAKSKEWSNKDTSSSDQAFPRYSEFQDQLDLVIYCKSDTCQAVWEVFDTDGHRLHFGTIEDLEKGTNEEILSTGDWKNGGYVINIILNGQPHAFKVRKPLIWESDK